MSMLKQLALNSDARIGRYLSLAHIAYTTEPILKSGTGAYGREEWTQARRAGYNQTGAESQDLDTERGFLQRAFSVERRKLESGLRLAQYLSKTSTTSVLEVGCGEMITSWAIKSALPNVRYHATDYDDFIIEKCHKLELLSSIEKSSLDIDAVAVSFLRKFEVVVAWDVFYAFDDERLLRFFEKIRAGGSILIICSSQIIGPFRAISYALKSRVENYAGKARAGKIRDHGFKCSVGHYRKIAAKAGLECELIDTPPAAGRCGDSYYFLRIGASREEYANRAARPTTS